VLLAAALLFTMVFYVRMMQKECGPSCHVIKQC
jgi:hypothetical protein